MPLEKLVLASANPGKLKELGHLLESVHWEVVSQQDFNVEPVEETGLTFVENALLKARAASQASGLPALGDDSGLVVDALNGQPGIYSARFAGENATDQDNNALLLERLDGVPMERRQASFYCCLALLRHAADPAPIIVSGIWHGHILETPRGDNGFGYDPLFQDPHLGITAAELPFSEKARISHRGKALAELIGRLKGD